MTLTMCVCLRMVVSNAYCIVFLFVFLRLCCPFLMGELGDLGIVNKFGHSKKNKDRENAKTCVTLILRNA